MDDLISRQAAIDAIDKHISKFDAIEAHYLDGLKDAKSLLKALPSAERKKGRWSIERLFGTDGLTYEVRRCSICDGCYQDVGYGLNYCPNCGAEMANSDDCD